MENTNFVPEVSYGLDPMRVAAFFIRADQERVDSDVTPMKLHKLLYLAQANYLASVGKRLFEANVEAFEHGPVVNDIRVEFVGRQIISPAEHQSVIHLSVPSDVEQFLEQIWALHGGASASQLRDLTHSQDPWKDSYNPREMHIAIPDAAMADYFSQKVPCAERVFHPDVLVVPESAFEDDAKADAKLFAFLRS